MRLPKKILLASFSVFAACSARGPASSDRSPSSEGAPIGPRPFASNTNNGGYFSGSSGAANPIFPRSNAPTGQNPPRGSDDSTRRHDRDRDGGRDVSSEPPSSEPRAGCTDENLMRIHVGDGFSAHDVLLRISAEGTFSGRTRIPRMRQVPLAGGASYWINDFASAVEFDRRTLAKWFVNSAPDVNSSDVYEAVRDSDAFKYAAQFVNSNTPMLVFQGQYDIGHRMAALLSVMLAASSQGDPDCVAHIKKEWMPKLLPNTEAQALMNQIRSEEAAQLVKEGRIHAVFDEVAANRQRIQGDLSNLDEDLKNKESQNEAAVTSLRRGLQDAYRSLRAELMGITPCRSYVATQESFNSDAVAPKKFAEGLVQTCVKRLNAILADSRNEQSRLQAELHVNEARRTNAEDALHRADSDGRPGEVERREKAIAVYDQKIEVLRRKNEAVAAKSQTYADYIAHITEGESNSVTVELRRINELLGQHQTLTKPDYFKPEHQQMERLRAELKANATHYLTTGFFGGFGSSDPAGAFSR